MGTIVQADSILLESGAERSAADIGYGSGAAWGAITGTLSAQTDLGTALSDKAPTSHGHASTDITGTAIIEGDSRLTNARTPTTHSHPPSEVTGTAVVTADSRLSDARTPTAHGHGPSEITGTAVVTADSRLSDARTPTTHYHAGTDINSGTMDGDRLPAISTTKKGGVPLTGSPSGKYLKDDDTWATPSGGSASLDVSGYRHYGVTNYESWYTSPRSGTALAGTALVAARMYAVPFICPKAITLDQIGIYVSTLSTTTARLGIYTDGGNLYPGSLLLDAGTVDVTATGAKKIAINQALSANTLYWLVIVCAATPAIYCIPVAGVINVLGTSNALGTAQNAGLYVAQTYGALPGTFPASPTMITAAPIPAIFVRLSA